jgi:hypothetical protein
MGAAGRGAPECCWLGVQDILLPEPGKGSVQHCVLACARAPCVRPRVHHPSHGGDPINRWQGGNGWQLCRVAALQPCTSRCLLLQLHTGWQLLAGWAGPLQQLCV